MMRPLMRTRIPLAILASALLTLVPGEASSQTSAENAATAEALFREAKALLNDGKTAAACEKFAASHRLDPAVGTLINLADCYERAGKTASAWAEFLNVATMARRANQEERVKVAQDRAKALEPRLSRLSVRVRDDTRVEGLEVRRDGVVLEAATWGAAVPVDPGMHTVAASAPKHKPWSSQVEVKGEGKTTALEVPKLELAPEAPPTPTASQAPPVPVAPLPSPSTSPPPPPQDSTWKTVGLITGGVGVAGLVVGSIFGLSARSKWKDADCPNNVCPTAARQDLAEDAKTFGNVSTVVFSIGGALLVGGAVMYFLAPSSSPSTQAGLAPPKRSIALVPAASDRSGGLWLQGSF